jgi:hypothetical protein
VRSHEENDCIQFSFTGVPDGLVTIVL